MSRRGLQQGFTVMTIERPMFPSTRRAFISTLATLPVAAAVIAPATAIAESDPIFAAIDLHLQARKDHHDAIDIETALEIECWKEKIVETDPRYIAAERATSAASRALDEAGVKLLNVQPTTIAGLIKLLDYFSETEEELFPSGIVDDEGEMSFVHAFVAHASQSLADIAQTLAQATV
jgi:predicted Fe-Mo cluster-binding NifX family protein